MKKILLSRNKFALVDDGDYACVIAAGTWYAQKCEQKWWYAARHIRLAGGRRKVQLLHQFLMKSRLGEKIDHADGNGLNCCRYNMRFCTAVENGRNSRKCRRATSSKYKGVQWHKACGKWVAIIYDGEVQSNGKHKARYLGLFTSEKRAAQAYDKAARASFGVFARTNFSLKNK